MSYTTLLESYDDEHKYANTTFAEMAEMLDSLNEFANEEIQFTVEISLQEAEDETIKDKAGKVGAALKSGAQKLITKLQEFINKIGEAVKTFVAKAGTIVKQGGNAAMKKIADSNVELKKEIKLTEIKGAKVTVDKILTKVGKAIDDISGRIKNDSAEELPASVQEAIDALGEKLEKSEVVANNTVGNQSAKSVYTSYVQPYLVIVDSLIKGSDSVVAQCKAAQSDAKTLIKHLQKEANTPERVARLSKLSSALMQISARTMQFANSLLTIPTKNAAKIALAAGGSAAKTGAEKAKEGVKAAPGKVKEGAGKAGAAVKDTAGKVKASAKAGLDKAKEKLPKGKKAEEEKK